MPQNWKPFMLGVVCAILIGAIILFGIEHRALLPPQPDNLQQQDSMYPPVSPDAVKIQPLLAGAMKFEGKKEFPQRISGNYARNITIVNFKASGENAHKSYIKIIWMDGSVEVISPGTANLQLTPGKNAQQIIVSGYAMHERKIFKDSPRAGILEWEVTYEGVYD